MIKAFRELYRAFAEMMLRSEDVEITIAFKNDHDLYRFQWELNKEFHWVNPSSFDGGTLYGILFKLKVKNGKH